MSSGNTFPCPKCGGRMDVKRTRSDGPRRVIRYRKCSGCEHRLTTREVPVGESVGPERSISGTRVTLALTELLKTCGIDAAALCEAGRSNQQSESGELPNVPDPCRAAE